MINKTRKQIEAAIEKLNLDWEKHLGDSIEETFDDHYLCIDCYDITKKISTLKQSLNK